MKSNLTAWCDQNLSNRALNALIVLAFTAEFDVVRRVAISVTNKDGQHPIRAVLKTVNASAYIRNATLEKVYERR